jgi:hypothetical protein
MSFRIFDPILCQMMMKDRVFSLAEGHGRTLGTEAEKTIKNGFFGIF